jgi:TonB family protein
MYEMLSTALVAALFSNSVVVASAKPTTCTVAHRPAVIVRSVEVQRPLVAQIENLTGTSVIRVELSETGAVDGSSVEVSSGFGVLDQAAMQIARSMEYAPETRSCTAVSGTYAVEVDFGDPSS